MKPSITVIIPCFNSVKFISRTIESVLKQDYEPMEIIAVDDGSTDGTADILHSYLPKIRILSHPNNANYGQYVSLNLGIKETNSDLVAFLDHDDIWYRDKIKKQVAVFENNPEVGLVYTNEYALDENDRVLYKYFPDSYKEKNVPGEILLNCYIQSPSSVMVRRCVLDTVGLFKSHMPRCADHDMWIRINEITKFHFIPDCLIGYRKHPDQMSVIYKKEMWQDGFAVLKEARMRYLYKKSTVHKRLAVLHYRVGGCEWTDSHYLRALTNIFLAAAYDPFRALRFMLGKLRSSMMHSILSLSQSITRIYI
jgi:glycosyltransferase involved in cell wall biosynthesis